MYVLESIVVVMNVEERDHNSSTIVTFVILDEFDLESFFFLRNRGFDDILVEVDILPSDLMSHSWEVS